MIKLLRAGIFRLKKEIMFWLFIIVTILIAGIRILRTTHNILLNQVLYDYIIYIGLFIAMFVSIFVGKEHSEGIIRNKIIVGHSRVSIYLSKLIISILVSLLCEFIYIAIMILIGSHIFEKFEMPISQLSMIMLNVVLIIAVYCSIFNLISMICSEITISVITCVVIFITMFIAQALLGETASIPKYITHSSFDSNGVKSIISQELNPNYPGDDVVKFAETIYLLLPPGQATELTSSEFVESMEIREKLYTKEELVEKLAKKTENLHKISIYSLILISIINVGGLCLFSKKELK